MLAAALTVWLMFSLWILAPHVEAPRRIAKLAGWICIVELVTLLTWSYGIEPCEERACAPLARAAGVAATVDIPVLAGAFLLLAALRWRRQMAP